jgi:hypothetical protein
MGNGHVFVPEYFIEIVHKANLIDKSKEGLCSIHLFTQHPAHRVSHRTLGAELRGTVPVGGQTTSRRSSTLTTTLPRGTAERRMT